MCGLTILVVGADGERLHAALSYAAAGAALDMPVKVHLHEAAVSLLRAPIAAPGDGARQSAGLPTLAMILDDAIGLGVKLSLCQSGLALSGLAMSDIDRRIEAGGPVGVLSQLGDGRLVVF